MIDTSDLHPDLSDRVRALIAKLETKDIHPVKTSGCRGFLAQATLYQKYRREGGPAAAPVGVSRHHPFYSGRSGAVDLGLPKSLPAAERARQYRIMGTCGKELGLVWGGDWRSAEPWHFELPDLDPWDHYIYLGTVLDRMRNLFWSKATKAGSG